MKMNRNEQIELSRKHAIAVLQDKGKILPTAVQERIPSATLLAMLGVTYEDGAAISRGGVDKALLYWHNTGFKVYLGNPTVVTKRQRVAKDARLIKTALAETMKNRREAKPFSTKAAS